jgi:PKD repeat protein
MLRARQRVAIALVVSLAAMVTMLWVAPPAYAAATTTSAFWSMDEAPGATTFSDSSGNNLSGTVGADVQTGVLFNGATAHRFPNISPTAPPARPQHLDQVPSNTRLNPDAQDYAVTVRYRTTKSYGNILQKGQNATTGGYWKFEQPNGIVYCLFKGSTGQQRTARSDFALNDGQWHTVRCERTASAVTMYVDGVQHNRLTGPTGTIANTWELSIGGKSRCDQIDVTCDYFVGDIDYIRIEKGSGGAANVPPTADLATDCTGLICSMSAAGSTDSDGAIQTHAWNFGDGKTANTGSVKTTSHTYASPGTYTVTLTVTDDRGATDSTSSTVTVAPIAETISFVGAANANANATTHRVVVPAAVSPGDGLLLFLSENTHATISEPTGVTGWVPLDTQNGGYATTRAWRKVAAAGDEGSTVSVNLSGQSKGSLTLAAYRGTDDTDPVATFAKATDTSSTATRVTPTASVTTPTSWGVSYWMHGDATSTALTPPANVLARASGSQTGGGRVITLLADSNAGLPAGAYGGLTATAAAASTTTTTWTVILDPA